MGRINGDICRKRLNADDPSVVGRSVYLIDGDKHVIGCLSDVRATWRGFIVYIGGNIVKVSRNTTVLVSA